MPRPDRLLRDAAASLGHLASPGVDARLLLAHVLRIPPSRLPLVEVVEAEAAARFAVLVGRRAAGEPLQHLTGEAAFRHVVVRVGPGVFVPRPETEVMTGWLIDRLLGASDARVVELCAGSGAISLALSGELPGARIWAVEQDAAALAWARRNLAGTPVTLVAADMSVALHELDGTVDAVVVNPPYVPLSSASSIPVEVAHDPPQAVFSGIDGLDAIRSVADVSARLLRPGGWLACEHDDAQESSAPAVFAATNAFTDISDHRDLAGRPRFVTARRS
ncbi:peptide chain release factor N(5)-glutamine methyltransferase [Propionicicella superfundia]|uniref:peptide chain release factor N(5)-glutamine methyltransferase n=1 Tax=Propionicicella superfundia TaxID=348582 RepID=UPI0003FD2637|nr:peptide chain release factor N(5)-glutamine methyltransferase [Propionicicella superfundia]